MILATTLRNLFPIAAFPRLARRGLVLAWALLAGTAQALGPWKKKNPYGSLGADAHIVLGDSVLVAAYSDGVTRIGADGGWSKAGGPFNREAPEASNRTRFCSEGDTGYAFVTHRGIFRTLDEGRTWEIQLTTPFDHVSFDFRCRGDAFLLMMPDGLHRGDKRSRAWTKPYRTPVHTSADDKAIQAFGHTFVTQHMDKGLIRKSDVDTGWIRDTTYARVETFAATKDDLFLSQGWAIRRWDPARRAWDSIPTGVARVEQMAAAGEWLYVVAGFQVRRTRDRGATWESNAFPRDSLEVASRALVATESACLVAAPNGLFLMRPYRSEARQLTRNFTHNQQEHVAALGPRIAMLNYRLGGYRSDDAGATWHPFKVGAFTFHRLVRNQRSFFAGVQAESGSDAGVIRSDDGGKTWTRVLTAPRRLMYQGLDARGDTVVHADGKKLRVSVDNGETWSAARSLPDSNMVLKLSGGSVLAFGYTTFYTSRDLGAGWERTTPPFRFHYPYSPRYAHAPEGLYMTQGDTIALTMDGGATWLLRRVPPRGISSLAVIDGQMVACGAVDDFHLSRDGARTWEVHQHGMQYDAGTHALSGFDRFYGMDMIGSLYSADPAGTGIRHGIPARAPTPPRPPWLRQGVDVLGRWLGLRAAPTIR